MATQAHLDALMGDEEARRSEIERIVRETKRISMIDKDSENGHHCFRAGVHPSHFFDEEVWSEPRWVNPRTIWSRFCIGVKDETPYETIVRSDERGVWVWTQDEYAAPGQFPLCRKLAVDRAHGGVVLINTEIWRKPPREWPPGHYGDSGSGVKIDLEQTIALRDFLTKVIEEVSEEG